MPDGFKKRAMENALSGRKSPVVLDLGCGPGDYARHLTKLGATVVSVDLNKSPGIPNFVVADAVKLHFKAKSFDAIIAFDVFEHVPDIASALSNSSRVLRDDGVILLSVPNDSLLTRLYFTLTLRKPPSRTDPTHVRFLGYLGWRKIFSESFRIVRVFGQFFTEGGSLKRAVNGMVLFLYQFTPNIYFLLAK